MALTYPSSIYISAVLPSAEGIYSRNSQGQHFLGLANLWNYERVSLSSWKTVFECLKLENINCPKHSTLFTISNQENKHLVSSYNNCISFWWIRNYHIDTAHRHLECQTSHQNLECMHIHLFQCTKNKKATRSQSVLNCSKVWLCKHKRTWVTWQLLLLSSTLVQPASVQSMNINEYKWIQIHFKEHTTYILVPCNESPSLGGDAKTSNLPHVKSCS